MADAFSMRSAPPPGFGSWKGPSSIAASLEPEASPERRMRAAVTLASSSSAASSAFCLAASSARYACLAASRPASFLAAALSPSSPTDRSYLTSTAATLLRSSSCSRITFASSAVVGPFPRDIGALFTSAGLTCFATSSAPDASAAYSCLALSPAASSSPAQSSSSIGTKKSTRSS